MLEMTNIHTAEKRITTYPGIRLEPAQHGRGSHDVGSGKVWNPELTTRLASYQPILLAIDSIQPIRKQTSPLDWSQQRLVSEYFPGEPRVINPDNDAVYVVGGDVVNLYSPTVLAGRDLSSENSSADFPNEIDNYTRDSNSKFAASFVFDMAVSMAIATTIYACCQLVLNTQKQEASSHPPSKVISRRDFLKISSGAALTLSIGAILGGRFAAIFSSQASTEVLKNSLIKVANSLASPTNSWAMGRTALLTAKSQDVIDFLELSKESSCGIVMGSAHVYDNQVLEDENLRNLAIHDLAKSIVEYADKAFDDAGGVNQTYRKSVLTELLNLVSSVDVYRVENKSRVVGIPDYPFSPDDVKLESQFKSNRVESCISDLRIMIEQIA